MKILYLHQYFTTRDGATGTRSYEFSKIFKDRGHEVTVITGDSFLRELSPMKKGFFVNEYQVDGIRVFAVRNKYSNYMGNIRRLISFLGFMMFSCFLVIRIPRPDITLATSTPLTVVLPAMLFKFIRKIPFVFEVRDLWPEAPIQLGAIKHPLLIKFLRWFESRAYHSASHIIALSPGMEEGILKQGISREKVSMVPNCADLEMFDQVNGEDIKKKYGLEEKFVVTHCGSMGIANGLDYVVNAALILKNRGNKKVVFMLTGDGKTKPMLEKFCRKYGIQNVIFTGSIPRKDIPLILAVSHITLTLFKNIPILATNSPNKFFDSLAAGKPVIINSNGWTKEIVEKYKIGFYVNPDNPEELAELVLQLTEKIEEINEMGRNARKLAEKKYDRKKLALYIEQILISSLNSKGVDDEKIV